MMHASTNAHVMDFDEAWANFFEFQTASNGRQWAPNDQWHDGLIIDLPHILPHTVAAQCRACGDAFSSPLWRSFTLTRNERTFVLYACSGCYEKMRRIAAREHWCGEMTAYICHVFEVRQYWSISP